MSKNNEPIQSSMGILYKTLEDVLHESMIPYTEHVVMDRALPRVEDGLKPVQRRILYAMYTLGLMPDKPYRKSATVVGECLGHYHPHGDASVYDAAVRMAQDFSLREPLIDGHGNFGSIDGDGAAAYRYTEMKLKDLALELLRDINKDTIHWSLNFDDRLHEPDTLPGRFPNLLVNGAYGIAVGVATNIPPHNLAEVIDAVVAFIDKPSLDVKGLMKYIKGPDFPTGANIIAGDELRQAYETGKGKITVRSTVEIENVGDKQNLVITDIPYQVNKAQLLQKIAELKENNKDKLACIQEIRDESDRNGIRAVIRLKKDANARAVLEYLYKATTLQTNFGINMVAIAGGKPKQMNLQEIIAYYVEYQRQVIYRRTKFDLDACKERAHILEGLLIAIKNIDEVIKIIKQSESVSIAKQNLKDRFLLSEKQAVAILEMRLSRLVNLEVNKIKEELAELKKRIEELTAIYLSKAKQFEVVKTEILEIKKQYKNARRTKLLNPNSLESEVVEEPEEVVVRDYMLAITANNTIKAIPIKNYNLAVREVGENSSLNEIHTCLVKTLSTDKILILTNKGNVYKTVVDNIPEAKWRERGTPFNKLDKNILPDEKALAIIKVPNEQFEVENTNLVFVTANGMIKKSPLNEYLIAKTVFQGIKLKDKDSVVYAGVADSRFTYLLISKSGMAVNIADDLEPTGRMTSGVKAMALDAQDLIAFALPVKKSGAITVLTKRGYIKNVSIGEYEVGARNRKGLRITGKETGDIAYASFGVVPPNLAVYADGKISVISSKYIPYDNRAGKGRQVLKDEFVSAFNPQN
ncbi:MAG: DNA topoisomerase 4 subunit A [Clostridia bacterium]|nr:DNA topoisomerase 4 subunit A [Clostridia bacterium]